MVLKFFSFLKSHSFRELSWAPGANEDKLIFFYWHTIFILVRLKTRGNLQNYASHWCTSHFWYSKENVHAALQVYAHYRLTANLRKKCYQVSLTCGQIVSVLRESNGGDRSRVTGEVGHVGALLQIPNLNLGVRSTSAKNETIRVELSACESWGVQSETLCLEEDCYYDYQMH